MKTCASLFNPNKNYDYDHIFNQFTWEITYYECLEDAYAALTNIHNNTKKIDLRSIEEILFDKLQGF